MSRYYFGSWFGFPDNWLTKIKESRCVFAQGQLEICPTTKATHVQFFVHFSEKVYCKYVNETYPGSWLKPKPASAFNDLVTYVTKKETAVPST